MPRREDFENSLWSDPDFLALSHEARLVYIWTWTNPRCGMAGIYRFTPASAVYELGLNEARILAALEELSTARFVLYVDNVLWVRTRVKHLRQKTVQIAKAIRNDLAGIPRSNPLRAQFIQTYGALTWLSDQLSGDPHEGPTGGSPNPADRHATVYGTGTGKGTGMKGRGSGRGRTANAVESPEKLSAERARREQEDEFCAHFPGVHRSFVMNAVRELTGAGEVASVEAVAAVLADERPAA